MWEDRELHGKYRQSYRHMCKYLLAKNLNTFALKEIKEDILGMMLDCQQRGGSIEDEFSDVKVFCDEVSVDAIQRNVLETIVYGIFQVLMGILLSILLSFLLSSQGRINTTAIVFDSTLFFASAAAYFAVSIAWYGQAHYLLISPMKSKVLYGILYLFLFISIMWIGTHWVQGMITVAFSLVLILAVGAVFAFAMYYAVAWYRYFHIMR